MVYVLGTLIWYTTRLNNYAPYYEGFPTLDLQMAFTLWLPVMSAWAYIPISEKIDIKFNIKKSLMLNIAM